MPVEKAGRGGKKAKERAFPPSLAGGCLRYAVMDVLGFGRLIDKESMAAMRAGTALHKEFQQQLRQDYAMCSVEVPLRDNAWGVSGRMDALVETQAGPLVIEYKTVRPERFQAIRENGPLVGHWAQLQLYLVLSSVSKGALVVDERPRGDRLIYHGQQDPVWSTWLQSRIAAVKQYQVQRKLPPREVSLACLSCDRWRRCFASEEERDRQVREHPVWDPNPPVPLPARYHTSGDVVS